MPLTGIYSRALDDKRRVAVPKRLRDDFGEKELRSLYVAPGTDRSLVLYSPEGFHRLAERLEGRSANRAEVRNYLRLFYSQAERLDFDNQGRIRIPDRLAEFAGLQREVMLLGVHDHAEIWDRDLWEQFLARNGPAFDQMAAQAHE